MISNVTFSFDLTYTNPVTGALEPRIVIQDLTDYAGLGINLLLDEAKGLGQVTFQGDIISPPGWNTNGDPMIDLQNWDYVNDGTPTRTLPLPLDLNGNVVNGVYGFTYSLRLHGICDFISITLPDTALSDSAKYSTFLEPGNTLTMDPSGDPAQIVSVGEVSGGEFTLTFVELQNATDTSSTFDITNVQVNKTYTYSGCTKTTADVSFVYDCEYGNSGSWAVTNTTPLASNETVSSLNCTVSYPSWTALTPTFNPQVVLTSLPYPSAPNTETPLATGTYTVSMTESIEQTQTDGLVFIYSTSVIKEFVVSCAGTLCGLVPCIENLRSAHQAELVRNKVSKYQVYVDNVVLYYMEALNYKACGELDKYQSTLDLIKAQLDASGCDCACCDDESYYWVSNNSGVSVIESLIASFQFRLFDGIPGATQDNTQGVEIGALWEDFNTGIIYRCTVNDTNGAVWEEYYAPGFSPTAAEVPAEFAGHNYLTANNVQLQLDEVDALAIFDGINGLNKVGNDVQLGGTLDTDVTINVNGNDFIIESDDSTLQVIATAGVPLLLNVNQGSSGLGINAVLATANTAGVGANGIGSSIQFAAETAAGSIVSTSNIKSTWTNASDRSSNFQITTRNSGTENVGFTLNAEGSVTLNKYGAGTFSGTAEYNLAVDASGNVIEVGPFVYAGRTRLSGGAITISEYANTTGATMSISNTGVGVYTITSSIPKFAVNTVAFIQLQGAPGFTTTIVTNSSTITINTYDATGVLSDAVIAPGSFVKIEIYS